MTRFHLSIRVAIAAAVAVTLASCGAKAPVEASQTSLPIAPATVKADMSATTAFKTACTDKITAKMIDPAAAKIAYAPLSNEDGFQAEVKLLNRESGGTIEMDFTCVRTSDGRVVTQLVSD